MGIWQVLREIEELQDETEKHEEQYVSSMNALAQESEVTQSFTM